MSFRRNTISCIYQRTSAHKCDQCIVRQKEGRIPACVEVCKVGALVFEDYNKVMDKETDKLASLVYLGIREKEHAKGSYPTLLAYKNLLQEIKRRQS
jgi:Fe-S-cluster-containing dehydrogenase component